MGKLHLAWLSLKANKKSAGIAAAALAVGFVLLAVLIGAAIGRYQTQMKSEASVRAMEFYFTSDLLDGGAYTLAAGSTQITFTLSNHADELRFSEMDIAYTVTVEPSEGVTVTGEAGTLTQNVKSDATVTVEGLQAGETYTVRATGEGGYERELKATIQVLSNEAQIFQHQEYFAEYTLLTLWNEGETAGTVQITYTGIPDNTNPNMTGWLEGETQSRPVTIEPHKSMVFRFFGEGTVNVTKDGIGVTSKVPN